MNLNLRVPLNCRKGRRGRISINESVSVKTIILRKCKLVIIMDEELPRVDFVTTDFSLHIIFEPSLTDPYLPQ